MYRSAVILIMTFVLAVLLLIVVAQTFTTIEMLAVIDERTGAAQVVHGNRSQPAALRMLLHAGERVRTGADGRVGLHYANGVRIEVGSNSEFVVQRCRLDRRRHVQRSRFRLNLGQVWIRLRGALEPGSKFEVETPTIVAAVRGTIFGLQVAHDGTTELQVYRGEVEIDGAEGSQGIASGDCATVGRRRFDVKHMSAGDAAEWQQIGDIIGPMLVVNEPVAGSVTAVPLATVHGVTEPAAVVSINGERVAVNRRGAFRGRTRLADGENVITIVALLGEMRSTVQRTTRYRNPASSIVITTRPSADPHAPQRTMEVTAVVRDGAGQLAPDGTMVRFAADQGFIESGQGTHHGVATVLWQPADGGTALVTATCGSVHATTMMKPAPGNQ